MRAAFAGIIDYAGLFPPAGCTMADAIRQYDVYRRSSDRWMLDRFVVAAIRLEELGETVERSRLAIDPADGWKLSAVLGANIPDDAAKAVEFNDRWRARGIEVDSVECRISTVGQIFVVNEQIPPGFVRHFEVPHRGPYGPLVEAIGRIGTRAKIRTGGTKPELFPPGDHLGAFIRAAVHYCVPFKATAGLHHPWAGVYPLTYDPGTARHRMYGFVNVLLATAEAIRDLDSAHVEDILEENDREAFRREPGALVWRDRVYTVADLVEAHRRCFRAFGSCSFREPVDEFGIQVAA